MKKILSLLLAGLMVMALAAGAMAAVPVTPGTKLPLETIYDYKFINGYYPIIFPKPIDPPKDEDDDDDDDDEDDDD